MAGGFYILNDNSQTIMPTFWYDLMSLAGPARSTVSWASTSSSVMSYHSLAYNPEKEGCLGTAPGIGIYILNDKS